MTAEADRARRGERTDGAGETVPPGTDTAAQPGRFRRPLRRTRRLPGQLRHRTGRRTPPLPLPRARQRGHRKDLPATGVGADRPRTGRADGVRRRRRGQCAGGDGGDQPPVRRPGPAAEGTGPAPRRPPRTPARGRTGRAGRPGHAARGGRPVHGRQDGGPGRGGRRRNGAGGGPARGDAGRGATRPRRRPVAGEPRRPVPQPRGPPTGPRPRAGAHTGTPARTVGHGRALDRPLPGHVRADGPVSGPLAARDDDDGPPRRGARHDGGGHGRAAPPWTRPAGAGSRTS
ncbi:hypothetical protein QFZ55_003558 [Streptomyces luteogriseus]|nr:hypothetical protein [Streptomyces luteogriseus]